MRRGALTLLLAGLLTIPALAADRAPRQAINAAKARAAKHYGTSSNIRATFSIRSSVDRRWVLVTGDYRRSKLWAAWLRRGSDARWRVSVFRTRNFSAPDRVPCDIRTAYSEPSC